MIVKTRTAYDTGKTFKIRPLQETWTISYARISLAMIRCAYVLLRLRYFANLWRASSLPTLSASARRWPSRCSGLSAPVQMLRSAARMVSITYLMFSHQNCTPLCAS
ncbi:hypothetical protein VTK56DRAFT_218 [Thermocarpiscus australiensis]